jgi:hypothetical protein
VIDTSGDGKYKVVREFDENNNLINREEFEKITYSVEYGNVGAKGLRFSKWVSKETDDSITDSINNNSSSN